MTGQSKKTETTSKRKNRSSQGETSKNITSLKNQKTNKSTRTSSDEVEELKRKISELQAENNELTKKNNHLQYQLDNYGNLSLVNEDNESQVEESDDSTPPAKRQMRKRPSEEDEKAKTLMKTLLKTFPELELNEKEIFTSQANNNTCIALVPELQKLMSEHKYNPSSEQVMTWLKSIHGTKRKAFLKSNPSNQQSNQSNQPNPSNQSPINDDSQETEKKSKEKKQSKSKNEEGLKIEESAKSLMKRLLKNTYVQDEYKLKFDGPDGVFTSQVNIEVCKKLIPRLIDDIKPTYELSYKQVESWLKSGHRCQRNSYIKSNRMGIDDMDDMMTTFDQLNDKQKRKEKRQSKRNAYIESNKIDIDDDIRSAKRQTKTKGKKKGNLSEEEEEESNIEDGAKALIMTLLKTFPELELMEEKSFGDKANVDIRNKLVPELMEKMKAHGYNFSREQVESWLLSIHKSKRKTYLKSNQISSDDKVDNEQDSVQSVGQQIKLKGKEPNNFSEDEDELKIEDEAKVSSINFIICMLYKLELINC